MNNIIYKLDSHNKIRYWKVFITPDCKVKRIYGQLGGKQQSEEELPKPKNIGKSNETTICEQAKVIANSYYNKKLDEGFKVVSPFHISFPVTAEQIETVTNTLKELGATDAKGFMKPMLAYDIFDRSQEDPKKDVLKKKYFRRMLKEPFVIQPKFDGVRCIAAVTDSDVKLTSRTGKDYSEGLEHIRHQLRKLLPPGIYDGELYIHGMSLQEIVSIAKAPKKKPLLAQTLNFVLFDTTDENKKCFERLRFIQKYVKYREDGKTPVRGLFYTEYPNIHISHSIFVANKSIPNIDTFDDAYHVLLSESDNIKKWIKEYHNLYVLEHDYEGIIIRFNDKYEPKRSHGLLKYKEFTTNEYEILGGEVAKKEFTFICKYKNGTFNVSPPGTKKDQLKYKQNIDNYVGKQLTVKHLRYTNSGAPYAPKALAIRDY